MVKNKLLILLLILCVFLFRFWQATGCRQFVSLRFNFLSIKINVESQTDLDSPNRTTARFFHNKITAGIFEVGKAYVKVFEPQFLLEQIGPLGIILLITSVVKMIKNRQRTIMFHLLVILALSILAIFRLDSKTFYWLGSLGWMSFGLWGIDYFSRKKSMAIMVAVVVLTFWYFLLNWQMPKICHEIFFN